MRTRKRISLIAKNLIDLNKIDRLNTIVNMNMRDPVLSSGFKITWRGLDSRFGFRSDEYIQIHEYTFECGIKILDVWKYELDMKRLTVMRIYNYTLQSVLKLCLIYIYKKWTVWGCFFNKILQAANAPRGKFRKLDSSKLVAIKKI